MTENDILSVALNQWLIEQPRSDWTLEERTLLVTEWVACRVLYATIEFDRAFVEAWRRREGMRSWAAVIRYTERAMAVEEAERKVLESACEFARWGGVGISVAGISVCHAVDKLLDAHKEMKRGGAR